jgi:hypothetical protein
MTALARKRISFGEGVLRLMGHLVGSAVVFFTILLVEWSLGFGFHFLSSIYPFDPDVVWFIHKIQMCILVFDFVLSGLVLLAGAIRFTRDVGVLP